LLAFGWAYSTALHGLLGHAPPSPWDAVRSMPAATRLVLILFGALGAPLAEELFFRGYLFGRFKASGHLWFGLVVSSILFGIIHFSDPYNVPGVCAYGAVLAWMFHRYDSLLAPIAAHAVNNGVAIASMMMV
jgi:hypothetical protein